MNTLNLVPRTTDILDQINLHTEFHNKVFIDDLGRIEIIDDELLKELKAQGLAKAELNTTYLNFSCNGNSSCY